MGGAMSDLFPWVGTFVFGACIDDPKLVAESVDVVMGNIRRRRWKADVTLKYVERTSQINLIPPENPQPPPVSLEQPCSCLVVDYDAIIEDMDRMEVEARRLCAAGVTGKLTTIVGETCLALGLKAYITVDLEDFTVLGEPDWPRIMPHRGDLRLEVQTKRLDDGAMSVRVLRLTEAVSRITGDMRAVLKVSLTGDPDAAVQTHVATRHAEREGFHWNEELQLALVGAAGSDGAKPRSLRLTLLGSAKVIASASLDLDESQLSDEYTGICVRMTTPSLTQYVAQQTEDVEEKLDMIGGFCDHFAALGWRGTLVFDTGALDATMGANIRGAMHSFEVKFGGNEGTFAGCLGSKQSGSTRQRSPHETFRDAYHSHFARALCETAILSGLTSSTTAEGDHEIQGSHGIAVPCSCFTFCPCCRCCGRCGCIGLYGYRIVAKVDASSIVHSEIFHCLEKEKLAENQKAAVDQRGCFLGRLCV
eukprot:NODE_1218_length_1634_cov_23.581073_g1083_i0.p1 GENE.NODE_1218_length_1634_cov_23.581073_g1083_i0~~NODE_1218_length_1634_cov_23.581073_g1083_i0.p1  ORF type:complete len:477 (-),score=74.37 NODE_1218_length_1634_cov_23.581073_g1083_i0:98-1528(-)